MAAIETVKKLTTPRARLSFPHLFEAQLNDQGKPVFSCVLIFDPAAQATKEFAALKAAAQAARDKKFGTKKVPAGLHDPFHDAGEKAAKYAGYNEGDVYINLKTSERPGMIDGNMQPILERSELYPGCYVRATLSCYAFDKLSRGVAFGLNNLQKIGEGEPLDGRTKATDDFEPIGKDSASELDQMLG